MGETVVVNLRREPYDVYIGRARHGQDGYFGNPHPVDRPCPLCGGTVHRRGEAVAAFKRTFWKRVNSEPAYRERMQTLRGKRLGCFCKPEACHGDVITAWLDAGCPLKAGIPPAAAPAPTATPPPPVVIREFRGLYGFLSNFWPSPVIWQGVLYPSVEHAYQAAKTDDPAWIARIAAAATPPSPALRQTLAVLERATTWPQIATLGRETFGASKRWPSHERKQFWAAYHHRKVELQPSHADHAP